MSETSTKPDRLGVAAISFLNPAPLLWDFEHEPRASALRSRYDIHYTLPSLCAAQLANGDADLGLIPIAALATLPEVRAVSGCTIASRERVRSIQLAARDAGLRHIEDLVTEWQPRTSLPEPVIRHYLTSSIHYSLDSACLRAIERFYQLAEQNGVLPGYHLRML